MRDPKICKFYNNNSFCKFDEQCAFKHEKAESKKVQNISELKHRIEKLESIVKDLTKKNEQIDMSRHDKYIDTIRFECEYCILEDTSKHQLKVHMNKRHKHRKNEVDEYTGHRKIYKNNMRVLEGEITSLKERNSNLLKKVHEIFWKRVELESEIDHLKGRLGEDILDEESDSD